MLIGEKIKNIRELRNYTQDYVADKLGITQAGYSKIEKGTTSMNFEKLEKLAIILEVDIEYIINFDSYFFLQKEVLEKENNKNINKNGTTINILHKDKVVLLEKLVVIMDSQLQYYIKKYGQF